MYKNIIDFLKFKINIKERKKKKKKQDFLKNTGKLHRTAEDQRHS